MKFEELLHILKDEPIFETSLLLAGDVNPPEIRRQLSRWTKAKKIHLLKRGLYTLAAPYRQKHPHPFYIANRLLRGSYVSCQSALAYYGMIPEYTASITSVTVRRPGMWSTTFGRFEYRHIKSELFHGYDSMNLGNDQTAYIASSEKALLDLIYLVPKSHSLNYLKELRIHFEESFDLIKFNRLAENTQSPKLLKACLHIGKLHYEEKEEFQPI
jgi:predicted transcriptional regulator of viral defense system